MALHRPTAVAQAEVTLVDAIKITVYCSNCFLLNCKQNEYGAKKFIAEFPNKPCTLSELNKRLPNTGHFTF